MPRRGLGTFRSCSKTPPPPSIYTPPPRVARSHPRRPLSRGDREMSCVFTLTLPPIMRSSDVLGTKRPFIYRSSDVPSSARRLHWEPPPSGDLQVLCTPTTPHPIQTGGRVLDHPGPRVGGRGTPTGGHARSANRARGEAPGSILQCVPGAPWRPWRACGSTTRSLRDSFSFMLLLFVCFLLLFFVLLLLLLFLGGGCVNTTRATTAAECIPAADGRAGSHAPPGVDA
jgi:hypothetical protein